MSLVKHVSSTSVEYDIVRRRAVAGVRAHRWYGATVTQALEDRRGYRRHEEG
ncbi:hypothetical protein [Streptomyces sp. CA-106110]|uniref:hypothetical protein n=1 Tax=Streptomyces sp. CA-106110 TaxID=3240044 RepID=UPI003D923B9F